MPRKTIPKTRGIFERPKGSGIWWISYCDTEDNRHREKVGRRGDALKLYGVRKAEIQAGKKLPQNMRRGGIRFQQLADDILVFSANHHGDQRNVKSRVKQILPDFGEREASKILPSDIDNWIAKHTKTPATANRYKSVFSLIFREALRNGKVPSNPARLVPQRHEQNGRRRYLLEDEERRLRKAILEKFPKHLPEPIIAIGTGQRKEEQYSLDWSQVDFNRREVHLLKTKNWDARDIPMNREVFDAFQGLKGDRKHPTGKVFDIKDPKDWFASAKRTAGITDFRWHDCRHTFCSRLTMAGVGLKTVQILAGHKTIAMTARYAHLAPSSLQAAVETINNWKDLPVQSQVPSGTRSGTTLKRSKNGAVSKVRHLATSA